LLVSWGGAVIAAAIVLVAAAGSSVQARWRGAVCVLVASGRRLVLLVLGTAAIGVAGLVFPVPCMLVAISAGWLAANEWPRRNLTPRAT
jgi:hypothetical protein